MKNRPGCYECYFSVYRPQQGKRRRFFEFSLSSMSQRMFLACIAAVSTVFVFALLLPGIFFPSLVHAPNHVPPPDAYMIRRGVQGGIYVPFTHLEVFLARKIRASNPSVDAVELSRILVSESKQAQVDPLLVAAAMKVRSRFDTSAKSRDGKAGLILLSQRDSDNLLSKIKTGSSAKTTPLTKQVQLAVKVIGDLNLEFDGDPRLVLLALDTGVATARRIKSTQGAATSGLTSEAEAIVRLKKAWEMEFLGVAP